MTDPSTLPTHSSGLAARDRCSGERWLVAGALIGGYELIRELGRGAGGAVWRARHVLLRSEVALKVLAPDGALGAFSTITEGSLRLRFAREAHVGAVLGAATDRVVRAVDAGEHDGVPYLVMQLCEGPNLDEVIASRRQLSARDVAAIAQQLAEALDVLHGAGFVHRDVKPGNVLCASTGPFDVRLTDFGVVKAIGQGPSALPTFETRTTVVGTIVGSPSYMSPEQVRGEEVGPASDHWSLAVTLYECLTGEMPFDGDSLSKIATAILSASAPPPSTRMAEGTPALDAFFARAFARDPLARFESARALAAAFEAALQRPGAPAPQRGRRVRARVAGGAAVALAMATAVWWTAGPAASASRIACVASEPLTTVESVSSVGETPQLERDRAANRPTVAPPPRAEASTAAPRAPAKRRTASTPPRAEPRPLAEPRPPEAPAGPRDPSSVF